MSKNNVRIAIRDSTDSHNVAFFDNKAGIKYKSANLQRFLAGSASILTIKYNSKDIDSIRSGCKLAFRYKNRDYWLNVMSFEKKGFEVELTAYSLGLELNNETRGEHKPENAMSIAEYVAYYDPEHALTIGVNEVSDKRIKLEWTGTDTILARLFSVANSFGAELDFSVELNDDYSLKRQVLNIYKKGNLGTNKVSQPVRVGKELKVINYSDNIKELRTAVRATGKDGLTIDGLNKKIYDSNKQLLYYSSGMTVYAPQSRDRFPSVGKGSNDNWIVEDLGETQYETKEALWGYLYSEIQKKSVPEITYEVEGAIEAGIGDTQTLIDDIHFEPALYVQARVSELEDDILTGKVTKSTFINFERKYSQIADILLKQVEALAEDAAPYIIRLSTNNGYIFKNGEGSSTITARLEKYSKDIAATWKWVVDNKVVGTGDKLTVKAEQVTNTMAVTVIAYVNGNEVVRDYMTFSNSDDGVGVESIDRYFTSSDQSDGVTIEGAEWSDKPPAPTEDGKYLWAYDEITYTDGTVTTTKPAAVGANFDVDAFRAEIAEDLKDVPDREEFENKIAEELANSKAEIETQIETAKTQAESNAKEYADTINGETAKVAELANAAAGEIKADLVNVKNNLTETSIVANNAQAAVDAAKQDLAAVNTKVDSAKAELTQAKQQLTTVADDLSKAKTDLQNAVSEVDTKATNLQSDLSKAKQDLTSQAQQLQAQASAQSELTKRVSSVEKTADGTKTTVSELSKTVAQNGKDITSVTARTKTVEDDLAGTKTTLSQVKTTADSASQKTATLETGLDGLSAKFDSLKVGSVNLLKNSKTFTGSNITGVSTILNETYQGCAVRYFKNTNPNSNYQDYAQFLSCVIPKSKGEYVASFWAKGSGTTRVFFYNGLSVGNFVTSQGVSDNRGDGRATFTLSENWQRYWVKYKLQATTEQQTVAKNLLFRYDNNRTEDEIWLAGVQLEEGNIATDYRPNESDLEQKVAEYKQNADQNYVSLQTTVQNLDGMVTSNKATADQTAAGFKTRIESLETYKDGETTRANQYFESAKTETAKQLTAERTAIANNYVAKSTYTSDVTGIRNDLSATTTTANTTKTNLANYQASNDRAVANLQSNLQTANGNISSLKTKVEAVPGQITSAVSAVEGKIPTSSGGRNLALATSGDWSDGRTYFTGQNNQVGQLYRIYNRGFKIGDKVNVRIVLKYSDIVAAEGQIPSGIAQCPGNVTNWGRGGLNSGKSFNFDGRNGEIELKGTVVVDEYTIKNEYWNWQLRVDYVASGKIQWKEAKAEVGDLPTPWSPAPEDTAEQISNLSSEIKQTADGITLLATKTELNNAKNELQSGINTATNKANSAQSTANNNAQTINTHTTQISALNTGLQAKVSQTEFNTLSGRVTTAENNITAKANELSSKITSVEGKLPSGEMNLVEYGRPADGYSPYAGAEYATHPFYYNGAYKMYIIKNSTTSEKTLGLNRFKVERNTDYTLYFKGFNNSSITNMDVWFLKRVSGSSNYYDSAQQLVTGRKLSAGAAEVVSVTFNTGNYDEGYLRFDNNGTTTAGTSADLYFGDVSVKKGKSNNGWSPSLAELASSQDLKTAQSEIKQTTDAIKASVQSLDNNTVKSSSLTINTDGVVIKAGKSTSDFANAVGSYFSVNQNAINLFSDKINVKGSMIVSGAITSDKIASKQINTSHLNGKIITADVISSNAVTADAIRAGAVTTDKMSANTINGDRIAAGTLDAAKIKAGSITASQIASGTITSAQIKAGTISAVNIAAGTITGNNIKANSVDVSKIVGIDANFIKAKIEYAMIDWLKGKTITAYNDNMTIDLQNGRISFKDGSNAVYRQTPDGIHTGFLHFEAGSLGGIYAAFGATSTRQGINSKSSEFAGIRCYRVSADGDSHDAKIDKIEVIGDTVQFGHGYRSDGSIGGGFIMDTAAFGNETPYSMNRVIKSIEALWRILHDHAKNTGYQFNDSAFINALNNEYNAWHDMHND